MLFRTTCEHCRVTMEVSRLKIGKSIVCSQCDREFVAAALPELLELEVALEDIEPDVQPIAWQSFEGEGSPNPPRRKHHLTLPPPPPEEWNDTEEEDDDLLPGQRFKRFRPSKKRLKEFLDRDSQGDDYSSYLVAGLVAFGVVLLVFMICLIVVIFRF